MTMIHVCPTCSTSFTCWRLWTVVDGLGLGKKLVIATLFFLTAACSTVPAIVGTTYRTVHKTQAEVSADMYDCEQKCIGSTPCTTQCLESRGYMVRN